MTEYEYEQLRALEVLAGIYPKEIARMERMRQILGDLASITSDADKQFDLQLRMEEIDAKLARARYDFVMGDQKGDEDE